MSLEHSAAPAEQTAGAVADDLVSPSADPMLPEPGDGVEASEQTSWDSPHRRRPERLTINRRRSQYLTECRKIVIEDIHKYRRWQKGRAPREFGVFAMPRITVKSPIIDRLITRPAAACYLNLGLTKFDSLVREGRIPAVTFGRRHLFDPADLDAFVIASKQVRGR